MCPNCNRRYVIPTNSLTTRWSRQRERDDFEFALRLSADVGQTELGFASILGGTTRVQRCVLALLISLLPAVAVAQANAAAQAARLWRQQHERAIVDEFVTLL